MLHRWLLSQGEAELTEKVATIDKSNHRQAISQLLKLLFEREASTMEEAVAELFSIRENEIRQLESLKTHAVAKKMIIEEYHQSYENILMLLKENSKNYAVLKAQMMVLNTQYRKLLELDKAEFYSTFNTGYPLVLLSLMANEQLRGFVGYDSKRLYEDIIKYIDFKTFLGLVKDKIKGGVRYPEFYIKYHDQLKKFKKEHKTEIIGRIYKTYSYGSYDYCKITRVFSFGIEDYYLLRNLTNHSHVKTFSGKTDSYWKDIEPRGKQFMIIKMETGNKLRNSGASGEEFTADDINGKFIFTDGIDYRCKFFATNHLYQSL